MEEQTASQIAGRLMGGAPLSSANTVPDESGLAEVAVESQYRVAPEDAARLSMTPVGAAATRGNPMLAARLAQALEKPDKEASPLVTGGMYRDPKTGNWTEIPGYTAQQERIAGARRAPPTPAAPKEERIVPIIGADGKPKYVRESEAVGQMPFTAKTSADVAAEENRERSNRTTAIETSYALSGLADLIKHPGRKAATGASYKLGEIPGTDARGFTAKLETFKSQTFIPMVKSLVGMGALSNAEGQKLSDAVGALNVEMKEDEFLKEMVRVGNYLYDKAKAHGLEIELPEAFGKREGGALKGGKVKRRTASGIEYEVEE